MKSNSNLFEKCHAAWLRLQNWRSHRPTGHSKPNTDPHLPPPPLLSPLDRITDHLHRRGLGQQVHVRFVAADGDYVLEDADGFVHAKDYAAAVVLIERIWRNQSTDSL